MFEQLSCVSGDTTIHLDITKVTQKVFNHLPNPSTCRLDHSPSKLHTTSTSLLCQPQTAAPRPGGGLPRQYLVITT